MRNKTLVRLSIDREGQLNTPDLHDAEVVNLLADHLPNREFVALTRTEDGTEYEIRFFGVKAFACQNLCSQNVIREVMVWSALDLAAQLGHYRSDLGLSDEGEFKSAVELAKSSSLHLLHAVPSVGADLIVLCEKIEISRCS